MKRTHRSAGAIVVSSDPVDARTLLLEQVRATGEQQVVAPKGTIEGGESPLATAVREVREETGLTQLTYVGFLGQQRYSFTDKDDAPAVKTVDWFLFATDSEHVQPLASEGFTCAEWLPLDQATEAASHAGFSHYIERAHEVIAWRRPGGLAYSRELSDIVWHLAREASDLLEGVDGVIALCGSAARGDFVSGWSDIDIVGWGIDPASDIAPRISALAAIAEKGSGIHTSVRLADADGRDASGAGSLYDMKLQAVLARGAIDVPVIAGTQPLPIFPGVEDHDLVPSIDALRDFAITRLNIEPRTEADQTDRARRVLSVMCSAARNVATTIDTRSSLRLPHVISVLGDAWPDLIVVQLLTEYDMFRQAGARDRAQAEVLASRVPAALAGLKDAVAGEPVLSASKTTLDR